MQAPVRLRAALRTTTDSGIVMAVAVSMATFVATPLILPAIAERYAVGTGAAGLFSAAQLGAFVLGSAVSGRVAQPSRRIFVGALVLLALTNAASVVGSTFELFVAIRGLAGLALGVLSWLAYSQVFGDKERVGDVAVVGPMIGVIAAPAFGFLLAVADDRGVFSILSVLALVPLLRLPQFRVSSPTRQVRSRPVPQALVLVAALGLTTFGGSAMFVFLGAVGIEQYGMEPLLISIVFSMNALASIPAARWRGNRRFSGAWLFGTAGAAIVVGFLEQPLVFWVLVTAWGFCFWAAVPGVYNLLSNRSRHPAERAGDAQASMAAGRALGPLVGGFVVSVGDFESLGIVSGAVVALGAAAILVVELVGTSAGRTRTSLRLGGTA